MGCIARGVNFIDRASFYLLDRADEVPIVAIVSNIVAIFLKVIAEFITLAYPPLSRHSCLVGYLKAKTFKNCLGIANPFTRYQYLIDHKGDIEKRMVLNCPKSLATVVSKQEALYNYIVMLASLKSERDYFLLDIEDSILSNNDLLINTLIKHNKSISGNKKRLLRLISLHSCPLGLIGFIKSPWVDESFVASETFVKDLYGKLVLQPEKIKSLISSDLGAPWTDYRNLPDSLKGEEDILILMVCKSLDNWDYLPNKYKTDELAVKIALRKSDKLFYPWEGDPSDKVFDLFKTESEKTPANAATVFGYLHSTLGDLREGFLYKYLSTFTCKTSLFENVKKLLLMTAGANFTEGQQMAICLDINKFCFELNTFDKDISIHLLLDVIATLNLPLVEKKDFKEWRPNLKLNFFSRKRHAFLRLPSISVDSYKAQAKLGNLSYIFYGFTQSFCWQSSVNSLQRSATEEKFVKSLMSKDYFNVDLKKNRKFQERFFKDFSKIEFLFPLNQDKDDEEFIYQYFLECGLDESKNLKDRLTCCILKVCIKNKMWLGAALRYMDEKNIKISMAYDNTIYRKYTEHPNHIEQLMVNDNLYEFIESGNFCLLPLAHLLKKELKIMKVIVERSPLCLKYAPAEIFDDEKCLIRVFKKAKEQNISMFEKERMQLNLLLHRIRILLRDNKGPSMPKRFPKVLILKIFGFALGNGNEFKGLANTIFPVPQMDEKKKDN